MQYGDFIKGGRKFKITEKETPRNWYNYLWNDNYITFVSQVGLGCGFVQDRLSNRVQLVTNRAMFLLDEKGNMTGLTGLPAEQVLDGYSCVHGHGYSYINTFNTLISSSVRFFVPDGENGEIWTLTLTNNDIKERKFTLLTYCGTEIDGAHTPQGYNYGTGDYEPQLNGIFGKSYNPFGSEKIETDGIFTCTVTPDGYDCAENAFVGPYGAVAYSKAVRRGGCTNTPCLGEKLGFGLQHNITLAPGESKTLSFNAFVVFNHDEAVMQSAKFSTQKAIDEAFEATVKKFETQISHVSITTPDETLNELFPWICHQSNLGSRWARVRHNGFRDMTSDTECFAGINPNLALERLKRIFTYQYSNGYAPRTIQNGAIRDNNFSDNTVWLTFATNAILKELGDKSILDIEVEFNDGTSASIYEHIRRSVDFLYNFRGLHGLIKLWGGDWNDCMNLAGIQGKGVSVWLSIAWLRANKIFEEIARIYGKDEDAVLACKRTEEMTALIEEHGWDGEYYLCAYTDNDEKIGSHTCDEGAMFLIPQLWSVFAGLNGMGRDEIAMENVEKNLSSPIGTLISKPPYTYSNNKIGEVTRKPAGVHENGGVYLHTIAWKIAVDALRKRPDLVENDINTMLPHKNPVVDGRAEPYAMCNSYFGKQTGYRYGTPGQSWRTATGQWFQKALVNYVYGLYPEMEGLRVEPCLPASWKTASISKKFRDTTYNITYQNDGVEIHKILVDGVEINGNILPLEKGKTFGVTVITK